MNRTIRAKLLIYRIYLFIVRWTYFFTTLIMPDSFFSKSPLYYHALIADHIVDRRLTIIADLFTYGYTVNKWIYIFSLLHFHNTCMVTIDGQLYDLRNKKIPYPVNC